MLGSEKVSGFLTAKRAYQHIKSHLMQKIRKEFADWIAPMPARDGLR